MLPKPWNLSIMCFPVDIITLSLTFLFIEFFPFLWKFPFNSEMQTQICQSAPRCIIINAHDEISKLFFSVIFSKDTFTFNFVSTNPNAHQCTCKIEYLFNWIFPSLFAVCTVHNCFVLFFSDGTLRRFAGMSIFSWFEVIFWMGKAIFRCYISSIGVSLHLLVDQATGIWSQKPLLLRLVRWPLGYAVAPRSRGHQHQKWHEGQQQRSPSAPHDPLPKSVTPNSSRPTIHRMTRC